MVARRSFLKLLGITAGMAVLGNVLHAGKALAEVVKAKIERITMSDEEWKNKLSSEQYDVLRKEGTERAFTSPLNEEKREGVFVCAGCDLPLFPSKFKYNSGTGWPSFYDVLPGHVETKTDYKIGMPRTEYHCAKCGGHQGHVFEDGPKPTGLRYCNNGVALKFIPDKG
jgi:peptide-methionine (R)-S-oxide reductase